MSLTRAPSQGQSAAASERRGGRATSLTSLSPPPSRLHLDRLATEYVRRHRHLQRATSRVLEAESLARLQPGRNRDVHHCCCCCCNALLLLEGGRRGVILDDVYFYQLVY